MLFLLLRKRGIFSATFRNKQGFLWLFSAIQSGIWVETVVGWCYVKKVAVRLHAGLSTVFWNNILKNLTTSWLKLWNKLKITVKLPATTLIMVPVFMVLSHPISLAFSSFPPESHDQFDSKGPSLMQKQSLTAHNHRFSIHYIASMCADACCFNWKLTSTWCSGRIYESDSKESPLELVCG